jgi:leader peptidase (prepilin peptidase) / N-methyltransferase
VSDAGLAILTALFCGAAVLGGARWLLPRVPEPAEPPADKVAYAAVASWPFALLAAVASAAGGALTWLFVTPSVRPLWLVLSTAAVLLAAVDARTTWLPLPLTQASWLLMAGAVILSGALAGTAGGGAAAAGLLLRTSVGVAVAGGIYLVIWLLTKGGFGFGDVRFAPLVGAATAADSIGLLVWGLAFGSLVGGLYGLIRLLGRRSGSFAYAPSILAGPYVALAVRAAIG